jgi:hypothetical protein
LLCFEFGVKQKNGNAQKEGKHLEIFNKKTVLSLHQNILNSIYCSTQNKFVCVVKQKKKGTVIIKKIDIKLFLISGNLSQFVHHNLKRQRTINVR